MNNKLNIKLHYDISIEYNSEGENLNQILKEQFLLYLRTNLKESK